jgi:hypothetical protein
MSQGKFHWRRQPFLVGIGALGLAAGLALVPLAVGEARERCTTESLRGEYGFKGNGSVVLSNASDADVAVAGRTVFDGRGGLTGTDTASFNGTIARETSSGTYEVRADCTGSETFKVSPTGTTVNADFVIVDGGREVFFIETDPGTVLNVTAERQ